MRIHAPMGWPADMALEVDLLDRIDAVDGALWDRLAGGVDPFSRHAFLHLLEASGSVGPGTGWHPMHLVLRRDGAPLAAVPLYLKDHSWGEYVFDHAWAEAYARAGGCYYPKLQVAVPFTPVTGPRLLLADAIDRPAVAAALVATARDARVSSLHVTFCTEAEAAALEAQGCLVRRGIQYHWRNRGYRDFADFLDALRSDKRKTIRKERERVHASGVVLEVLEGPAAIPALVDFFPFYLATVDRRWGNAYLSEAFFAGLARELSASVVFVRASVQGRMVAGALNLVGGDTLYGRLWGSLEEYRFLHFECCYYAALEHAIARGITRVEAGAQGPHKLLRGYEPEWTWSAHWLRDPRLADAVGRFLAQESVRTAAEMEGLRAALPYRRAG